MAQEWRGSCVIRMGGSSFDNFLALTLKCTKEEATCSGTITMSWPGGEVSGGSTMPAQEIVDGADGTILLDGQLAATIIIDTRTSQGSPNEYTCAFSFRGIGSAIVDGAPKHESGQENDKSPGQIAKKLMEGYRPSLLDKSGMSDKLQRFIIDEGETVERAMRRATREFGLVFWEQPDGNLVLEKYGASSGGGQHFILGRNFYEWTTHRDMAPRMGETAAKGNGIPSDEKGWGKDMETMYSMAKDAGVPFVKYAGVLIDSDQTKQSIRSRGEFEAHRRAAQGLNVTLHLSTWSDDAGQLWKLGAKHHVTIPVDGIDQSLTVTTLIFELTPTTRSTQMTLVADPGDSGDAKQQGAVLSAPITTMGTVLEPPPAPTPTPEPPPIFTPPV
jgi:prophage tail gpP-like protein